MSRNGNRPGEGAAHSLGEFPENATEATKVVARGEREILEAARSIRAKKAEQRRAERIDRLLATTKQNAPLPGGRCYPVIYADPPWHFEAYSEKSDVERACRWQRFVRFRSRSWRQMMPCCFFGRPRHICRKPCDSSRITGCTLAMSRTAPLARYSSMLPSRTRCRMRSRLMPPFCSRRRSNTGRAGRDRASAAALSQWRARKPDWRGR
jgi:hypothetical protein